MQTDWHRYNLEQPVAALVDKGVVKISRSPAGILIAPGHHVGEMRVSGAVLRVAPKFPALLRAMENLATRARVRITRHFDPLSVFELGDQSDPAGMFVRALAECVGEGVPWTYGVREEVTSFPRGKLDCSATAIKLASRGIFHKVVVRVPVRQQSLDFVRLVRTAHRCLSVSAGARPDWLSDAETLLAAFDWADQFHSLEQAVLVAEELLGRGEFSQVAQQLVARCLALLRRELSVGGQIQLIPGGEAKFQDLEDLWEKCVLRLVECTPQILAGGKAEFHGLSGQLLTLFDDGGPQLDPDIVVSLQSKVLSIVDAKYKRRDSEASATSTDLYQMSAYVRRTSARVGILVHFSDESSGARYVGTTEEGAAILSVALSPKCILLDGEGALGNLLVAHKVLDRLQ